ncbi:hypothetical protein ECDEC15B_3464 [Escherichia coli DEC15B]|nr:hypothetical protein ECDEC15B_3464 [Escherichia coli DEC15B]
MFHTIVSIKNDGHYFCRAGGNRPDGLNEPVTFSAQDLAIINAHRKPAAGLVLPFFSVI